jgi:Mn2+/Fe2+ NRAMP family transporter
VQIERPYMARDIVIPAKVRTGVSRMAIGGGNISSILSALNFLLQKRIILIKILVSIHLKFILMAKSHHFCRKFEKFPLLFNYSFYL